jgi:hypothetical protein
MEIECLLTLCDRLNIPYYAWKGTKHIYPTEYIIYDTTRMITDNVSISDTIDAITTFLDVVYKDRDYGTYIDNIYKYYDDYDKYKELLLLLSRYTYHYHSDNIVQLIASRIDVNNIPLNQLLTPYSYLLTILPK